MPGIVSHSDPLFEKFVQYYKHLNQPVSGDSLLSLYNSIDDKKWLEVVLSKYKEISPLKIDRQNIVTYQYSAPAGGLVECFLFYLHVNVWAPVIGKNFNGNAGGGGLPQIAGSGGTLLYNNRDDLSGSCDLECHFLTAATIMYFSRGGTEFAQYVAGGNPILGLFSGSGDWSG